jgi:hypothetical protein
MRLLRYLSYAAAVGLFLLVQGLHVARTIRHASLGAYSRSLVEFLGLRNERERYLLIRQGGKPCGYSGLRVERRQKAGETRYRVTLDAFARLIPWLGRSGEISLDGEVTLNDRGQILTVAAALAAGGERFRFRGRKEGASVALEVLAGGTREGPVLRIPAELGLGGVIFPMPPLGELAVGEERRIPYFNPLTRRRTSCTVRALRHAEVTFAGMRLEAIQLEVTAPAGTFEVLAAPDGDVLSVKAPGGFEFRRATSQEVRSLFRKTKKDHGTHPDRRKPD